MATETQRVQAKELAKWQSADGKALDFDCVWYFVACLDSTPFVQEVLIKSMSGRGSKPGTDHINLYKNSMANRLAQLNRNQARRLIFASEKKARLAKLDFTVQRLAATIRDIGNEIVVLRAEED